MITFKDLNPEVFDLPMLGKQTNSYASDAIDRIVDNILFHIQSENSIFGEDTKYKDLDDNQKLAVYLDEYFQTFKGNLDYEELTTIAHKLGTKYHEADSILNNEVSKDVTILNDKIQNALKVKSEALNGYEDPKSIKFDYVDLSSFENIVDIAISLCKKYDYNVNTLTNLNIGSLYKKLNEPTDTDVDKDTLKSILGEINITVKTDGDEEPNIDVNTDEDIPTEVKVNDEDKTDESTDTPDDSSSSQEEIQDANVDVNTPDNTPDNVSVTINGQKVNQLNDENDLEVPDTDTIKDTKLKEDLFDLVVASAFNKDSFKKLYNRFLNMHNSLDNKQLQQAVWFSKFDLNKLNNLNTKLSDKTKEILSTNIESLEDLQRLVAVNIDLVMRNKQDTLIITPRLLNTVAVDNAKAKGIDVYTWVRDYLRLYHNHNELDTIYKYVEHSPVTSGISLDKLITTRPVVKSKLNQFKETAKAKEKDTYLNLVKDTFFNTLSTYVDTFIELNPNGIPEVYKDKNNFRNKATQVIKSLANNLTNNNYSNIEDQLYSFYFNFWYHDTLTEQIYKDTSYQLQLDLHNSGVESLTTTQESNIRAKVMSNVIIDLLKTYF